MTDQAHAIDVPRSLPDLVVYQAGSVVSRVIFRNEGGVMTLFAFAEGEGLTEHSSPHDAIVQILDGRVRVTVGEEDHEVSAGEVLHLPASVPHALHGGEPFKMLLTLLMKPRSRGSDT
ncbi:MAG: cupin domain-containing protein [Longimicrobiales bacterium]|nr:cupin domain-containing protein [Longimicrobiales bacterium]